MNTTLTTDDIFEIVQGVEQRESQWYAQAMQAADNPGFHDTCRQLSNWHMQGKKRWAQRPQHPSNRSDHAEQALGPNTLLPNAAAMAGLTWFGSKPQAFARYNDWHHPEAILKAAAKRAYDLIVFYEGLKGFVDSVQAVSIIDQVICQEHRYLDYIEQLRQRDVHTCTFSPTGVCDEAADTAFTDFVP